MYRAFALCSAQIILCAIEWSTFEAKIKINSLKIKKHDCPIIKRTKSKKKKQLILVELINS